MFKYSSHHRLLKILLIATTCHQASLLCESEAFQEFETPFENHASWQYPEGLSSEQIHSMIYPDDSLDNSSSIPYYHFTHDTPSLLEPKDGQWPVYTRNEWEDTSVPQPSLSSEEAFTTPSFDTQPSTHIYTFPTSPAFQSQPEKETQKESVKQHFITFDPNVKGTLQKKEPLLTQEGQAKSYPFTSDNQENNLENNSSLSSATPLQPQVGKSKNETDPLPKDNELNRLPKQEDKIKFSAKRATPPAERLEKALTQPEEVIGKATSTPSLTTILDNKEASALFEDKEGGLPSNIDQQHTQSAASSLEEKSIPPNEENEIAQLSTPATIQTLNDSVVQQKEDQRQTTSPGPTVITPTTNVQADIQPTSKRGSKEISINFNNVAMIEYIRFISRLSNKNFVFDDEDLQFSVTIVSEEPTTVDNLMTALLQELRIRDLSLIEQGNNIIIHRNPRVRSPARIVAEDNKIVTSSESELVTRVFRLNTLDPQKASEIIRPLISEDALIEVLRDTNNLIITDLVTNVNKVAQLISTLDAPNSGVTIGQYVVRNAFVDSLVDLANKILQPIAQGNPFVLVPHSVSNSIFIVSNSFIVEKALAILQNLDLNEGRTKILSLETLQPAYENLTPAYPSSTSPSSAPGLTNGRPGGFPPEAPGSFSGGGVGQAGGIGAGGVNGGPNRIGPGGTQGGFGPGEFWPAGGGSNEFGSGGIGRGFGPNGMYPNLEAVPDSFPFGGLSTEGRLTPPQMMGQNPSFNPGGIGTEGRPSAIFDENRTFSPGGIGTASRWAHELPVGHIERTLFFIYKLRYRKGDNIEIALRKIANSLQLMNTANADLISAINSSQWIESSNALIFTGTATALEKVRELILEVDVPLRQVFIEMLILDTTIRDSLTYSVDWINRFGGGTTTGEEGFVNSTPGAGIASTDNFLVSSEKIFSTGSVAAPAAASPLPVATGFMNSAGFVAGVIGTHLTHNGTRFSSIGALVRAIHNDIKADIILNPKIITEDNNPAEIFVGSTDRYKTQSITNDLGSLVTNNFQFIDVGTTLRVTPLIGNNGIITLEIVQETTSEAPTANTGGNNQDYNLIEVLTKTRTVTKIHVPNGFFVVLSGMIKDNQIRSYSRIPCLGGIPLVGCIGKTQTNADSKRNLMLFIRPLIIETDEEYEDVTRRQQDVYRQKSKFRRSWNYEIDEALNFGNIKPTDPDDMDCSINERQQR
ncbi:MAG: type III secretion protein [Parachlamydiaceae bacterium]